MAAKSPQDRLALVRIRLQPRIGVTPGERQIPQTCTADIIVWGDFAAAAATDALPAALDYKAILARVVEVAHMREYNLVETLAYKLARGILEAFPVQRVNVKVRKQPPGLADKLDYVEVEVDQS
jgi:dihydroneopterin aldolase